MKKLFLFILLLSGCATAINTEIEYIKTINGSAVFYKPETENKLCTKTDIDKFINSIEKDGLKEELSIYNYDKIQNNTNSFTRLETYGNICNYDVSYYDYLDKENEVKTIDVEINDNVAINLDKLIKEKAFKPFIDDFNLIVKDNIVKLLLSQKSLNIYKDDSLEKSKNGKYILKAYPVVRFYNFKDKKKVYDYQFSVVQGLNFKLEKVGE